jgi:hypothetical protein
MESKVGTRNEVIGILLLMLSFAGCSSVMERDPVRVEHPVGLFVVDESVFSLCDPREFVGYEIDMVVEAFPIREPLRVRNIRGRITYPDWQGSWSWGPCKPILFLRNQKTKKAYEVRCDATGRFVFKRLPQGPYCFFACSGCPGYDGAYGVIIIDKKADPKNEINIELPFAAPGPHP